MLAEIGLHQKGDIDISSTEWGGKDNDKDNGASTTNNGLERDGGATTCSPACDDEQAVSARRAPNSSD